jgi:hemerythrin-like domain-containing protein
MESLINTLERQIGELERSGDPDYDVIREVINYFLSFPDIYHHPKEDLVFAKLKERAPEVAADIGDLRREHERLSASSRELVDGITSVLDDALVPRESLARWGWRFIELQRQHMAMEEQLFFPAAERIFNAQDWKQLEVAMTDQEDPLFGEAVGVHFDSISERIRRWQQEDETR